MDLTMCLWQLWCHFSPCQITASISPSSPKPTIKSAYWILLVSIAHLNSKRGYMGQFSFRIKYMLIDTNLRMMALFSKFTFGLLFNLEPQPKRHPLNQEWILCNMQHSHCDVHAISNSMRWQKEVWGDMKREEKNNSSLCLHFCSLYIPEIFGFLLLRFLPR